MNRCGSTTGRALVVSAFAFAAYTAAYAWPSLTDWRWQPEASGNLADGSQWQSQTFPVSGTHRALFDKWETIYTITLPNGVYKVPFGFRAPHNGGRLTLDGAGSVFHVGPADPDKPAFNSEPFQFYYNGHFYNMENRNEGAGDATNIVAVLDNVRISTWVDDDAGYWVLDRGSLSYPDRNNGGQRSTTVIGNGNTKNALNILYTNDVTTYTGNVQWRGANESVKWEVVGGHHEVGNEFSFVHNGNTTGNNHEFVVSGEDTTFDIFGTFLFGNSAVNSGTHRVLVKDGASLGIKILKQSNQVFNEMLMEVSDGGKLYLASSDGWFNYTEGSLFNLNVVDGGMVAFTNDFQFGRTDNLPTVGGAFLNTTNATVWVGLMDDTVNNGKGLRINRDWTPGPGTKIHVSGSLKLGVCDNVNSSITNYFDFSNAEITSGNYGYIQLGYKEPLEFTMTNGTATLNNGFQVYGDPGCESDTAYIGGNAVLKVYGDGISIGRRCNSKFVVDGNAVVDAPLVRTGRAGESDSAGKDFIFEMRGGSFTNSNVINLADDGNCKGRNIVNLFGGELILRCMRGWNGAKWKGKDATCILNGNGGFVRSWASFNGFINGFDEAYLGEKGLTIHADHEIKLGQSFKDMEGHEGKGTLILTGSADKYLKASDGTFVTGPSSNAFTVCAGGKTYFDTDADWYTHLIVTNNAIASLSGGNTGFTLRGLTLGDAVSAGYLELDATDVVTVDGPVSFPNGRLMFTSTPANGTYDVLRVNDAATNFPEAERMRWARMVLAAGHAASGHSYNLTTVVDGSGVATLSVVVDDAQALSGSPVWSGADKDAWSSGTSWNSGSKPGSLDNATFSDANAGGAVNLSTDETIGALTFSIAKPHVISGAGSLGFTDSGNALIAGVAGTNEIAVGVHPAFQLPVDVSEGAKIVFSGEVGAGGIEKRGDGNVTLASPGAVRGDVSLEKGTLTVDAGNGADATLRAKLEFAAADGGLVAVRAVTPVTVPDFDVASGNIAKFGPAPLVLESSALALKNMGSRNVSAVDFSLDETSALPADGFGALNVVEGRLVLRGTSDNAGFFNDAAQMMVGLRTTAGVEDPSLTVDNAYVRSTKHTYIGYGLTRSGDHLTHFWNEATLTVTNTAYMALDSLHTFNSLGDMNTGTYGREQMRVDINVVDNSTLACWWTIEIGNNDGGKTFVTVDGNSWLEAGQQDLTKPGLVIGTVAEILFDNGSEFGMTASIPQGSKAVARSLPLIPARVRFGGSSYDSHIRFRNGSVFHCGLLSYDATSNWATNYLHFADSAWDAGSEDFDFVFKHGDRLVFECEGGGLRLNPADGKTWTMHSILTGTDVVKGGEGTLVFDVAKYMTGDDASTTVDNPAATATLAITGTLHVANGTVRIADGSAVAGTCGLAVAGGAVVDLGGETVSFATLSGAGTVTNGTLDVGTLVYGEDIPTFDDVEISSDVLIVDFGRTAEDPLDVKEAMDGIVVAHYSGTAPSGFRIRAVNTGLSGFACEAICENGDITLRFKRSGFVVIIH